MLLLFGILFLILFSKSLSFFYCPSMGGHLPLSAFVSSWFSRLCVQQKFLKSFWNYFLQVIWGYNNEVTVCNKYCYLTPHYQAAGGNKGQEGRGREYSSSVVKQETYMQLFSFHWAIFNFLHLAENRISCLPSIIPQSLSY